MSAVISISTGKAYGVSREGYSHLEGASTATDAGGERPVCQALSGRGPFDPAPRIPFTEPVQM